MRTLLNKGEGMKTLLPWESRVGGSSSVVEDHDGSTFGSMDRSKVSINKEEEFIRRFGTRWGDSIGWLFEGRRRDDCLISKKFLTRDRLAESQESPFTFIFKSGSISGL